MKYRRCYSRNMDNSDKFGKALITGPGYPCRDFLIRALDHLRHGFFAVPVAADHVDLEQHGLVHAAAFSQDRIQGNNVDGALFHGVSAGRQLGAVSERAPL